jgi:hypothetical protein
MVVGSSASVAEAVQRLRHSSKVQLANARQMKEFGTENDVWLMGTRAMLSQARSSMLANGLSTYWLGFSFRDGFEAELKLNYATAAAANRVVSAMKKSPPPPDFPVQVSTSIKGSAVRMRFAVEQPRLLDAVDKVLGTSAAKPWLAMAAKSLQTSDEMVIYGLPGGPKTIQAIPNAPPPPNKWVIYGLRSGPKVL